MSPTHEPGGTKTSPVVTDDRDRMPYEHMTRRAMLRDGDAAGSGPPMGDVSVELLSRTKRRARTVAHRSLATASACRSERG